MLILLRARDPVNSTSEAGPGSRSAQAIAILRKSGFTDSHQLNGCCPAETPSRSPEPAREGIAPVGVPFMITQEQKTKLRKMGYDDDGIKKMTPEMAHSLLGLLARN